MSAYRSRLNDQRRFRRAPTQIAAGVRTPTGEDGCNRCTVRELGMGGCLLEMGSLLGVGRVVTLDLTLPDGMLRTVARVRYEFTGEDGTFHIGTEFVSLFPEDRSRLTGLLETAAA